MNAVICWLFRIFLLPYRRRYPEFCGEMDRLLKQDCASQAGVVGRFFVLIRMIYDIISIKPNQGYIPRFGKVFPSFVARTFPIWGGWLLAIALLGWNWYHTLPTPAIVLPPSACVISDHEILHSAIEANILGSPTQTSAALRESKLREQGAQANAQPSASQATQTPVAATTTPSDTHTTFVPMPSTASTFTPATQTPAITPRAIPTRVAQAQPTAVATIPAPPAPPVSTSTPLSTNTTVPTSTPKPDATAIPTRRMAPTSQPTHIPTVTSTSTHTAVPTSTPQVTPQATLVPTSLPTVTVRPTENRTPMPTDTALPTDTATPPNTPTPLPSVVPSATPTCEIGAHRPVDVILTLDRSTSMAGQKLEKARDAAKDFIGSLDLNQDQIGLVTFAREAELVQPLTNNGSAVAVALDKLTPSKNTNMASAIISATAELVGERHHIGALPVIVILSDGRTDPEAAQQAADLARQQGIRLITIGLGTNANEALLKAIAWEPDYYYAAPTPEQLQAIYMSIAGAVHDCDALNGKHATPDPTSIPAPAPTASATSTPSPLPTDTPGASPSPAASTTSTPSLLPTETPGAGPSPAPDTNPTKLPAPQPTEENEPPAKTPTPPQNMS